VTVLSRGSALSGDDFQATSQVTLGRWAQLGFDIRSFVQQQDHYPFYAFRVLDIPPGATSAPDATTDLIPSGSLFNVKRRMGSASARVKIPRVPVRVFVNGSWQTRVGETQLAYLDENETPTCGESCHYHSQFQPVNYTTRNVGGGADAKFGHFVVTWMHTFSSFNDRLTFPIGAYTGPFTPENEGFSLINPPPAGPAPTDFPAGNYYLDIPSPSQASSDRVNVSWDPSPSVNFNGTVSYTRLRNTFTNNPQNAFNSDETLTWLPVQRLRVTADYHQQNLLNDFTPYYALFGDVSYHQHSEDVRFDYELPRNLDAEVYYRRSGITRSNAFLWPQIYSIDNTDLLPVVPSSFSNITGMALRYHDRNDWSARAGYEWTGTHDPGYLIVPQSNNRVFADLTLTPVRWLTFTNDTSIILQNAFPAIPLPNTPGNFQRRNRFYFETASATMPVRPDWNLSLGYSYQQNNLLTYMAFQNDPAVNYVLDEPMVPYKQVAQDYWAESAYTMKQRLGLNLRVTYNSARSGFRPDVNPNDAAALGNQSLIEAGVFDPGGFAAALNNLQFSSTQISEVMVPQWIGQSKAYYLFPHGFNGGLIFYYGSYRDFWNPNLNGVLRTFTIYIGRSW
jgi:hypothetical protein